MALTTHPYSAGVKERVELYLNCTLWAFMDCSRVNFTFIVTVLWLEREWMVGGWTTTMLSTYGYGDRHRVTADIFCVSGCSDKELNSSTSPQLHFFRSKFRAPLRCRQIVRLSVQRMAARRPCTPTCLADTPRRIAVASAVFRLLLCCSSITHRYA